MVEVNCETDFAAKDENFLAFAERIASAAHAQPGTDVASLMEGELEAEREALVQKIGENCSVRRITKFAGQVAAYIHSNAKIGVLVSQEGGDEALGKDLAMHIAASNPQFVSPDQVDEGTIAKEREIYSAQAAESGKPPEIVEKMVEGRIKKFLSEISLTEQGFVKDPDTTVAKLLKQEGAAIHGFSRFEVGEGIEKEEVDFAAEVQQQLS
jgi:elongation factor Ts